MSKLTDRVSYLKGLADGLQLDMEQGSNKLLMEVLNLLGDMTEEMQDMAEAQEELDEYVESIDDDLADLEEVLFGDDDDCDCGCEDCMDDYDEDDDEDQELSFDCPNCGKTVLLRASDIESEEDVVCKHCNTPFFTDIEDDEE